MKKLLLCLHSVTIFARSAVTYEISGGGRFGDNLLSYVHAKWIAYKYQLPLLYKPFVYSDHLVLAEVEEKYSSALLKTFFRVVLVKHEQFVEKEPSKPTLYVVPYFPESFWERNNGISFTGGKWDGFQVDWHDRGFIATLNNVIKPLISVAQPQLPTDKLSVAVHVRRGGKHDNREAIASFPLKFLPDAFYAEQLKVIYRLFGEQPLQVHIFTDHLAPQEIYNNLVTLTQGLAITFTYREKDNSDEQNVIEDFFAMGRYHCLVHSESNYSFLMSKLRPYYLSCYPSNFYHQGDKVVYTQVNYTLSQKGACVATGKPIIPNTGCVYSWQLQAK